MQMSWFIFEIVCIADLLHRRRNGKYNAREISFPTYLSYKK